MNIKMFIATIVYLVSAGATAEVISVSIVTEILPIDPVSGMKSTHDISIDTDTWVATSGYRTGKTFGIPSTDDEFSVDVSVQPDKTHIVTIRGATETGMGFGFAPAIDYTVFLDFEENGSFKVSGRHDGYPAYKVEIDGEVIYRFEHKRLDLAKLAEPQEITIP